MLGLQSISSNGSVIRLDRTTRSLALVAEQDKSIMSIEVARERAEAAFKRKEQARLEGNKAMADYRADQMAMREKTARLRTLRLLRDEAIKKAAAKDGPA
jgi:hypothetical protein